MATGKATGKAAGKQVVVELTWCENVWCGEGYDAAEGWAGLCPSCLALADEHLARMHTGVIEVCVECRRELAEPRAERRSA